MENNVDLKQARQNERLRFIDLCAYVLGSVNRKLLMNRFDIEVAYASRDIKEYQNKSLNALTYNLSSRSYIPIDWFVPIYTHTLESAFLLASEGVQKKVCVPDIFEKRMLATIQNVSPDLKVVAPILRATNRKAKVEIEYISATSGKTTRVVIPHSLILAGNFKYVRGYDQKTGEFRTFKLNRITQARFLDWEVAIEMQEDADLDWNEEVTIKLKVNAQHSHKEAIEVEYGLDNGKIEVTIKKAMIPFFLMDWNIAPLGHENWPPERFPLELFS